MKRTFTLVIEDIPESEGGGYKASIPAWGSMLFKGEGDSPELAVKDLSAVTGALMDEYTERGLQLTDELASQNHDFGDSIFSIDAYHAVALFEKQFDREPTNEELAAIVENFGYVMDVSGQWQQVLKNIIRKQAGQEI